MMMSRGASRVARSLVAQLAGQQRYFSSITTTTTVNGPIHGVISGSSTGFLLGNHAIKDSDKAVLTCVRLFAARHASTTVAAAAAEAEAEKQEEKVEDKNINITTAESGGDRNAVVVSSYWGVKAPKVKKEDGTEWPWNCFRVRVYI